MNPDQPLSKRELDELGDFLASEAAGEDCMDVSMLHGFLTAVAIGPRVVLPSEWLPVVWGNPEGPEFVSRREALRIFDLILRMYNEILRTLQERPDRFLPVIFAEKTEEGKTEWLAEPWCTGFIEGMYLRKKDWEPLFLDEESVVVLSPILAFVNRRAMEELLSMPKEPKPTREDLVAMIPLAVIGLHSYWLERRKPLGPGMPLDMTPAAARARVGRNDPCPCGSGKKYKKCCALRPT